MQRKALKHFANYHCNGFVFNDIFVHFILWLEQNDLHEVADRIALRGPSRDIFSAVVQNAAEHSETAERELVDGLCSNEDLANVSIGSSCCRLAATRNGALYLIYNIISSYAGIFGDAQA